MRIVYPAIFHKEDGYWVEFPDLSGCNTFGDTVDDTLANAKEALEVYYQSLLENGKPVPKPSSISTIQTQGEDFTTLIDADVTGYENKAKAVKKTLTIPQWLNDAAVERGLNFSQVLQNALLAQISESSSM